ncbi:hypothetical protein [Thiothrix unzii]|jgi:hypothetical protein|uniref:hypothetical protein n=1 Tax=Thiothrix unzii TaxID=111769 RepID=UPI002A36F046|nr:hypothetical protein [Thiothrix unzii]MDX9988135.1 hypothetical protein [Thiothrix unzii]
MTTALNIRLGASILGATLALLSCNVSADLVIPEVAEAQKRFQDNPDIFDQTDQYCTDKTLDAVCTLPGTVFEGGGKGQCKRELTDTKISLQCQRTESVEIDRKIPDTFSIDPPFPNVTDRFCAKKKAQDTCSVTLSHNGKQETYDGVCEELRDEQGYRFRPQVRLLLSCQPVKKAPERVYTPVSTVRKLFSQGL